MRLSMAQFFYRMGFVAGAQWGARNRWGVSKGKAREAIEEAEKHAIEQWGAGESSVSLEPLVSDSEGF